MIVNVLTFEKLHSVWPLNLKKTWMKHEWTKSTIVIFLSTTLITHMIVRASSQPALPFPRQQNRSCRHPTETCRVFCHQYRHCHHPNLAAVESLVAILYRPLLCSFQITKTFLNTSTINFDSFSCNSLFLPEVYRTCVFGAPCKMKFMKLDEKQYHTVQLISIRTTNYQSASDVKPLTGM